MDELLLEQDLTALPLCARVLHCLLARIFANAERIGGELEVAEQVASGPVAATALHVRVADRAHDVGVGHTRVLEDHLGVLVEAPAALVEYLADAESWGVARDHEHRGALPQRRIGVSACVDEEELAHARIGDEALLAVEEPFVAVALRPQLQA